MRDASRRTRRFVPTSDRLESVVPVSTLIPGLSMTASASIVRGTARESAMAFTAMGMTRTATPQQGGSGLITASHIAVSTFQSASGAISDGLVAGHSFSTIVTPARGASV